MAPLLQDASKRSATVSKWLSWCGQRKNSVRVVEADIPAGIMPHKIDASLIDIKIGGKRGPDDAMYNKSQVILLKGIFTVCVITSVMMFCFIFCQ